MKKFLYLVLLISIQTAAAFGQSYPSDREKFTKALQQLISANSTKEEKDFIKDELEPALLNRSAFTDSYFNTMVTTCNALESKKVKAYPEIFNYIYSVHSFIKGKQSESSFTAWQSIIDKLTEAKNLKKFEDFIETSSGFFAMNRLVISSNSGWYCYGNYVFEIVQEKPIIRFTNSRLVCGFYNKNQSKSRKEMFEDSVSINGISGVFDLTTKKFNGNGGRITWEKTGLAATETYADLYKSDISLRSSEINIDTAVLVSPFFPNKKIMGRLNDRALNIIGSNEHTYPRFISYDQTLTIKNVKPGMNYVGGFALEGAALAGVGAGKELASLIIERNGKKFMKISSTNISIEPNYVRSNNAKISLYIADSDSIYHPGCSFLFTEKKDSIELTRSKSGIGAAPFIDTYHQLQWYVPAIVWTKNSSDLVFNFGPEVSEENKIAKFESNEFYDSRLYDRLQGSDGSNPLAQLSVYAYKYDEYTLTEGKAASALGKTIEQARGQLLELNGYGFISYDTEAKTVVINQKLIKFVDARQAKKDYDYLIFTSDLRPKKLDGYTAEEIEKTPSLKSISQKYDRLNRERRFSKEFGRMSLSTLELSLIAVDKVNLSDVQQCFVIPDSAKVLIKKNRNFEFTGWGNFGKTEIHMLAANYNYEANKINLLKTDYTILRVNPLSPEDGTKQIALSSTIYNVVGELIIDSTSNRSGVLKGVQKFPYLRSTKPALVYYSQKELFKGAYDSTRFFYTMDPFVLDSLDNYKEKDARFKGTLTSAGIFPAIKQDLRVMPDYSLGFSTIAPAGGHTFYGTGAKYNNKIILSNSGLQGAGEINFVNSNSKSLELFTFLPDSTVGMAKFTNKISETGVQFPEISSEAAYICYVPKGNVLKAYSTQKAQLDFFKGQGKLNGMALIRAEGITGNGIMDMPKAQLGSDLFKFTAYDIDADTSNFSMKNLFIEEGEAPIAIKTSNVKGHISFKERNGVFSKNEGTSEIFFPINDFKCKMDVITWLMDKDEMELSSKEQQGGFNIDSDLDLVGSNFFSTNAKQDSLQFKAPKASYSLKEKTIFCNKVEFLDIADARIYPDSLKVTIRKKGKIDPFNNCRIVANYVTKYHTFVRANVEVTSRKRYSGNATYPYFDADSVKTMIPLQSLGVDSSSQTIAKGTIKSDANFKLSKQFDFYGDFTIKAATPLITFGGATRINHECAQFAKNWMSFTAEIDPKNIQIPVSSEMKTLEGKPVAAGIIWRDSPTKDSVRLYPTFLSEMENKKDPILITSSGVLQYDFNAKEFQIASPAKLINSLEPGNFLALNTETCSMNGEGVINLGMELGDAGIDVIGTVEYDPETGVTEMNTTMRFNFLVEKGPFENLGERILAFEGSKPMIMDLTTIEQATATWVNRKAAEKLKSDYTLSDDKKIKRLPEELEKSIVITGIHLTSLPQNNDVNGFITNLDGASIVNFYGKPVMRQVICKAYFEQNYSLFPDHFKFYFQIPGGGADYMLHYKAKEKKDFTLDIATSDAELSAAVNAIKEEKRKTKNFFYFASTNTVYLSQLLELFQ